MSSQVTIGVYDPNRDLINEIESIADGESIIVAPFRAKTKEGSDAATRLVDQRFLLERATHLIILMTCMESLSILTDAIASLLDGSLSGVMSIGLVSFEQLAMPARHGQEQVLREYVAQGKLVFSPGIDRQKMRDFLDL
jgi:hypothetical protein